MVGLNFGAMSRANILLVEDDLELASLVARILHGHAMDVRHCADLAQARTVLRSTTPDVLVLDIMLPDGSGLDFCREVRSRFPALPVLMLSARGDTIDRVLGLENGADDYLGKPFDANELSARLRSMLRRGRLSQTQAVLKRHHGSMCVDLVARVVSIGPQRLELTSIEFKVLATLSEKAGQVFERSQLSRLVQPGAYLPSERSVDVQMARLRKKLRDADPAHTWIATVRGEGYAFTPNRSDPLETIESSRFKGA
jgi:DNA-binding response OmpR family regulator